MQTDKNIFEERFDRVAESLEHAGSVRSKLIEGVLELSEVRRIYNNNQLIFSQKEEELSKLFAHNQELKLSLMHTLVEKEELAAKKECLAAEIDMIHEQLDELNSESNAILNDESVNHAFERFATNNQKSLMSKILDAKCKLLKYGYTDPDRLE